MAGGFTADPARRAVRPDQRELRAQLAFAPCHRPAASWKAGGGERPEWQPTDCGDRRISQPTEFICWLPVIEIVLSASEEGKACPDAIPRRRIAHRDLRIANDITPYRSMARQGARVYIAGVN